MLLDVKLARVERERFRADSKLPRGQRPRHELSDREARHLDGDHGYDERLGAVGEEGVEEGEEGAREEAYGPHAEGPHREARVVFV